MTLPAAGAHEADYPTFMVLRELMSSPGHSELYATLRHHEGATYGVWTSLSSFPRGGLLTVRMSIENRKAADGIRLLRSHLEALAQHPVADARLRAARASALASYELSTLRGLAGDLSWLEACELPPEWLGGLEQRLAEVSAADVQRVAAQLDPFKASLVLVGDINKIGGLSNLGRLRVHTVTEE